MTGFSSGFDAGFGAPQLNTAIKRACGFGILLPFLRGPPQPTAGLSSWSADWSSDFGGGAPSDADTFAERAHLAMNYCGIATAAVVIVPIFHLHHRPRESV